MHKLTRGVDAQIASVRVFPKHHNQLRGPDATLMKLPSKQGEKLCDECGWFEGSQE